VVNPDLGIVEKPILDANAVDFYGTSTLWCPSLNPNECQFSSPYHDPRIFVPKTIPGAPCSYPENFDAIPVPELQANKHIHRKRIITLDRNVFHMNMQKNLIFLKHKIKSLKLFPGTDCNRVKNFHDTRQQCHPITDVTNGFTTATKSGQIIILTIAIDKFYKFVKKSRILHIFTMGRKNRKTL